MKKTLMVADLFCGGGGSSTGISMAAQECGMKLELLAVNHWERAVETHAANMPEAEHLCESIDRIDPLKAVPGKRLDLLWASPECTHHSMARGGRPRSDQSRVSAWMILKWLSELYVERVIIENVPEFASWGPLDEDGRPVEKQKGKTFRAFISSLKSLGYSVDWRILRAADYGDPTTRKRLFIQAVKGRKHIIWPQITHMDVSDGTGNLLVCKPWIPARDIIDWSIPGTSIFDRKRPLAEATLRRIAVGIRKYWQEDYAKPFLALLYGTSTVETVNMPLSTVTASGRHHVLVEPFLLPNEGYYRGNAARSLDKPVPTVTASHGCGALVEPFITAIGHYSAKDRSRSIDDPLSTVVAKQEHCLIEPLLVEYHNTSIPFQVSMPVKTITTKDRFGLLQPFYIKVNHTGRDRIKQLNEPVGSITTNRDTALIASCGLDIKFRMLTNNELARAHSFPRGFKFCGTVAEVTKQIGNSVPVELSKALTKAIIGRSRDRLMD